MFELFARVKEQLTNHESQLLMAPNTHTHTHTRGEDGLNASGNSESTWPLFQAGQLIPTVRINKLPRNW